MARKNYVAPDGAVYSIEDTDQPLEGWRPETPEEAAKAEAGNHPFKAAVEGAARTATFGLSDKFAAGLYEGLDGPGGQRGEKQLQDSKEANPIASTVGEVAGFFTPGPKNVSAMAAKAPSRMIGGIAEGGLFGLGSAISENTIGDPKLAGDNLAAGVLGGALMGGVLNPVLGKVGDLGRSALVKAFGGKALTSSLSDMAEMSVMRAVTKPSDLGKKSLRGRLNEVGRFALDEGFTAGAPSFETASKRAHARAKDAWKGIENALDVADTVGHYDPTAAAGRLQTLAAELKQNPAAKKALSEVESLIEDMTVGPKLENRAAMRNNIADGLDQQIQNVVNNTSIYDPNYGAKMAMAQTLQSRAASARAEAAQLLKDAAESVTPRTFRKGWDTVSGLLEKVPDTEAKGLKRTLFKARGEMQDDLFQQVARVDPGLGKQLTGANRDYANASTFSKLALKKADQIDFGNGFGGLTGILAGVGAVAHAGPIGMVAPLGVKIIRERGGFVLGSALEALAQSKTLPKLATGFQAMMRAKLSTPGFGGPFRATLETAAAKGAIDLLQAHMQLSTNPEYMAAVGLEHEDPAVVAELTDKAHRLGLLSNAVDAANDGIEQSIGRVLGEQSGKPPAKQRREASRAEYERVKLSLRSLLKNEEMVPKQLSELAPTTSGLAQMQVAAGAQYLLDAAPKDPNEGLPPALRQPWNPPAADLRAWLRKVDAVADPRSVLESMRTNDVTPEAVEALQLVYPRMYREMQERMMARLAEWDQPLDRKRRAQISHLLGDLEDPEVVKLIQTAHERSKPPMPSAPDGREKLDVEKNLQTQGQRLEGR